jgi:hypothetical protein
MKVFFSMAAILFAIYGFGQSPEEIQILKLSGDIFKWETENKINLLENIFSDKFVVVNAAGESQTKAQYLTLLRSGSFVHDSIDVEQNNATLVDNTTLIVGKGKFVVTRFGKKIKLRLSYTEVFTRPTAGQSWKILAMHASILQN